MFFCELHLSSCLTQAIAVHSRSLLAAAQIGVNVLAKFRPSFLSESDSKSTKTLARNFKPEFNHHVEFLCPLTVGCVKKNNEYIIFLFCQELFQMVCHFTVHFRFYPHLGTPRYFFLPQLRFFTPTLRKPSRLVLRAV